MENKKTTVEAQLDDESANVWSRKNRQNISDGEIKGQQESSHDGSPDAEENTFKQGEVDLHGLFEAILFLSNEPVPLSFFVKHLGVDATQAKIILDSLFDEYEERDGGLKLCEISNGYQFMTNTRYSGQIRRVMGYSKLEGLSKGMLETLAIIVYKQPIVIAEIEELRGVSSRMMVANLMKKNLIKPVGRKELPGRPLAYGTTDEFLKYFGLNKLSDLPKLSEIKEFSFESEE